jgi:hypothetical protein
MVHIVESVNLKNDKDDLNIQAWLKSLSKTQKPKQGETFTWERAQRG